MSLFVVFCEFFLEGAASRVFLSSLCVSVFDVFLLSISLDHQCSVWVFLGLRCVFSLLVDVVFCLVCLFQLIWFICVCFFLFHFGGVFVFCVLFLWCFVVCCFYAEFPQLARTFSSFVLVCQFLSCGLAVGSPGSCLRLKAIFTFSLTQTRLRNYVFLWMFERWWTSFVTTSWCCELWVIFNPFGILLMIS